LEVFNITSHIEIHAQIILLITDPQCQFALLKRHDQEIQNLIRTYGVDIQTKLLSVAESVLLNSLSHQDIENSLLILEHFGQKLNWQYLLPQIASEEFLKRICREKIDRIEIHPKQLLKYIPDPEFHEEIVKNGATMFVHATEDDKQKIISFSKTMAEALSKDILIDGTEAPYGKFVIGTVNAGQLCFVWDNSAGYHRDIVNKSRNKMECISGGKIESHVKNGILKVRIYEYSADFGFYPMLILERYRDQLIKTLEDSIGKPVELEIKGSSSGDR
jgi:hypothetical protein